VDAAADGTANDGSVAEGSASDGAPSDASASDSASLDFSSVDAPEANETKVAAYRCPAGIDVQLWTVQGGGHMDPLDPTAFGNAMWNFMSAHAKP
jgi:hypothetical protein